jgi:Cu2+-exporting ATPase
MNTTAPRPARTAADDAKCAHCAQPVPAGLIVDGAERQFCCTGCRAVYETIHACGLDEYYRLRDVAAATLARAEPSKGKFESFDTDTFAQLFVRTVDGDLRDCELVLDGLSCIACVWLIEKLPTVLDGVLEARLSLRDSSVRVTYDVSRISLSRIARTLDGFGYKPHPPRGLSRRDLQRREERRQMIHLGASFALMGNVMLLALALYAGMFGHMEDQFARFFRWTSLLLGSVSLAWPGWTFFRSAWAGLRTRTPNLDIPIALALAAGWVAGIVNVVLDRGEIYFDSLCVLVFLLLVGRFLQFRQQRKAEGAIELMFSMAPATSRIVRDGVATEQPTEALVEGDLIEVRSGELFPADGAVETGRSTVNQALLTGESQPVGIGPGSLVHAGAQNLSSTVLVRVDQIGERTRLGQLMKLIEEGIREKPEIVKFADTVGKWFVWVVSAAAIVTFAVWSTVSVSKGIDHAVALLIVTCPCVLGLATPLTIAVSIGRLAKRQILVKSGAILETLARGGEAVLDKTGTLTHGQMRVVDFHGPADLRGLLAELERRSNHPVARAIVEAWGSIELDAELRGAVAQIEEKNDGGITARVRGEIVRVGSPGFMRLHGIVLPPELKDRTDFAEHCGHTAVAVAVCDRAVAVVAVGDEVRADSAACVGKLRTLGWRPRIMSGDARAVVRTVAEKVGVELNRASSEVTPEQKLARVRALHDDTTPTLMIGDGVNDAAALAGADVGIAVHGGAEASLVAADVYVARPGLAPVVELVETSRRTLRIIKRNLFLSGAYNLLAGVLAMAGVMNPLIAAIIMPISSASVLSLAVWQVTRGQSPRNEPRT